MNKSALTNKWLLFLLCLFSLVLGVFLTMFTLRTFYPAETRSKYPENTLNNTPANTVPTFIQKKFITEFKPGYLYIGKYKGALSVFWSGFSDSNNYWVSSASIRIDKISLSDIKDVTVEIPYPDPKELIIDTNPLESANYYYIHAFSNRTSDDKEKDIIMKISKTDSSAKIIIDNTMPFMSFKCDTQTKVNSRAKLTDVIDDTYIIVTNHCLMYGDVYDYNISNPKITIYNTQTGTSQDLNMDLGNIRLENGYIVGNKVIKVKSKCVQSENSFSCPEYDYSPEGDIVKVKLTI